ncbi:unnamed protein product [Owenia fusiformis]|uniref:TBC1 domain family member 13 n=1 Tax=Owenia fusiformis TaxID=6347 RepID=A0A8S4NZM9_OWEFU|nr:unnamed protein product [Owenia fusiformis]
MAAHRAKLMRCEELLSKDKIPFKDLRELCFQGCPHESGIRAKCWKLLLNYLPLRPADWPDHLKKQRAAYMHFIDEIIIQPGTDRAGQGNSDVTFEDHPLNPNPESQWNTYFKDNDMLLQIDKDCRRLCPDLAFFQNATSYPCLELVTNETEIETLRKRVEYQVLKSETVQRNRSGITNMIARKRAKSMNAEYYTLSEGQEAHWEVVERILFIYGKLNPGQGYVQGMNEIIGPIYYTFASDPSKEGQENAEADTFYCFTNIMSDIRDNFIKSLDDSECGIGALMQRLMEILKKKDLALWVRLDQQEIKPQFFAFRWITLLLSQEFSLPDVQRIWDSLFSAEDRNEFLLLICCAMLILLRNDILNNDFSTNMKLVQVITKYRSPVHGDVIQLPYTEQLQQNPVIYFHLLSNRCELVYKFSYLRSKGFQIEH